MPEVLRRSFSYREGGDFYDAHVPLYSPLGEPHTNITMPSGEEVLLTTPGWEVEIDLHDADLSLAGIGRAADLLREELAKFTPPIEVTDEEICVSMPTGSNHSKKGYNLRFRVAGNGIEPKVPENSEYKVSVTQRRDTPYEPAPVMRQHSAHSSGYNGPAYLLD